MKSSRFHYRLGALLIVLGLCASTGGAVMAAAASASTSTKQIKTSTVADADDEWGSPTASALTQRWADAVGVDERDPDSASYEALKDITVSINQTRDLTTQGVTVSWSGASPTPAGKFSDSFFQIMQCWGDRNAGPTPQQCMWGTPTSALANMLGDRVAARTLRLNEDPAQEYSEDLRVPPPITNPNLRAYSYPFTHVDGTTVSDVSEYYTSANTNEISAARTSADGTGTVVFTTQNAMDAPHLGCGTIASACWLVVVPRATTTADGTAVSDLADGILSGSPLSATNWKDRLVFELDFQSIGSNCPLGNAEQRLVGHELFSEAMTSWQSGLCSSGTTYGWSQIGDDEARNQIVSAFDGAARLAVVSTPLPAEQRGDEVIRYAPIARNSIVVAYNIERQYRLASERRDRNGTLVADLTLNARLIAKLLTQSYRVDVPGGGTAPPIKNNPYSIVTDPEFVELNPDFADFLATTAPEGLLVSLGSSDANAQVWQWLQADPYAKAFLAGEDDGYGMKINPAYLALELSTTPTTSFPKADLSTFRYNAEVPEPGYGTLDLRPYMADMQEAARRAARGESGSKIVWDPFRLPPSFTSTGAQLPGSRFQIALTDRTSADRFGLRTANLVNQAGQTIAPTANAVNRAINAFPRSSDDPAIAVYDPAQRLLGAYPLATVSYAAVNVCSATATQLKDYAAFLNYAAGPGQSPGHAKGKLPPGYLVLPSADVAKLKELAGLLTDTKKVAQSCPTADKPGPEEPKKKRNKPKKKDEPQQDETTTQDDTATPPAAAPVESDEPAEETPEPEPEPAATDDTIAPIVDEIEPIATSAANTKGWRIGATTAMSAGLPSLLAGTYLMRRSRRLLI